MNNDRYNVIILLLTHNCAELVGPSVDSALAQSFGPGQVKIVAIDNASTDGTYARLMEYTRHETFSVYRLGKTCVPTRVLQTAIRILKFIDCRYIALLTPGDTLHSDFVARCACLMDLHATQERRILICEADMAENGDQIPLYSESCIFRKRKHYTQFLSTGGGHQVQCFFCADTFPKHLPDFPFCVDPTDWFKMAIYAFHWECIYLKESLARVRRPIYPDPLRELVLKLFLVKRLNQIRGTVFASDKSIPDDDKKMQDRIAANLGELALRYAGQAILGADPTLARKCLLFAEMVHGGVTGSELFQRTRDALRTGGRTASSFSLPPTRRTSLAPPAGTIPLKQTGP